MAGPTGIGTLYLFLSNWWVLDPPLALATAFQTGGKKRNLLGLYYFYTCSLDKMSPPSVPAQLLREAPAFGEAYLVLEDMPLLPSTLYIY